MFCVFFKLIDRAPTLINWGVLEPQLSSIPSKRSGGEALHEEAMNQLVRICSGLREQKKKT